MFCSRNKCYRGPFHNDYCRPRDSWSFSFGNPYRPLLFPMTPLPLWRPPVTVYTPPHTVHHYTPPAESSYKRAFVALGVFTTLLAGTAAYAIFNKN